MTERITTRIQKVQDRDLSKWREKWLLVCAGIPEQRASISTFVVTPWVSADDLNARTKSALDGSKFDEAFILFILGVEAAFYRYRKGLGWTKPVGLGDIGDIPRAAYIESLVQAGESGGDQEIDRLADEEARTVLAEIRGGRDGDGGS